MKKIMLFTVLLVCVVLAMPVCAGPKPKEVNATTVYRFVGVSTAGTTGDAGGVRGMNALCHADYGKVSRMCTTREWWLTPDVPSDMPSAWIQPTIIAVYSSPYNKELVFVDFTGYTTLFDPPLYSANCRQWTNELSSEPGVDGRGIRLVTDADYNGITFGYCDTVYRVACCAPATSGRGKP